MRVYWEKRPKATSSNPHWRTPDQLWDEAVRYFEWAAANPLEEHKVVTAGAKVHSVRLERARAFTINGLCAYLGVGLAAIETYAAKPEFEEVVAAIRNVIYTQKFEHAAAGLLHAGLIARDLGLADKQELTGKDGGPIQTEEVVNDAAVFASRIAGLVARGGARPAAGESDSTDAS